MRIGIVGAGMIGSTLAKLWVDAGHNVRMASRHPEELQPVVERLGERASAGSPQDAATFGEVVLLTVPLKAFPDLVRDLAPLLVGKVVLDTGNAYERRDGPLARQASAHRRGSAGWSAAIFPGSRWVKAFNTVYFKTLESEAHRKGESVFDLYIVRPSWYSCRGRFDGAVFNGLAEAGGQGMGCQSGRRR